MRGETLNDRRSTSLLFGKLRDPNIKALAAHFDLFVDQEDELQWDLQTDNLTVNGRRVRFSRYFGRADTFGQSTDQMSANYYLMRNYLLAHPEIRCHNRGYERDTPTKAANLILARSVGLQIPRTLIGTKAELDDSIVKPLTGGHYVVQGASARYAAIIQQRIRGINRRLFVVEEHSFGFEIRTAELDYRQDAAVELRQCEFSTELVEQAFELASRLRLSYAALDFVDQYFLEINTMPMFAAFDQLIDGQIARAIRYALE